MALDRGANCPERVLTDTGALLQILCQRSISTARPDDWVSLLGFPHRQPLWYIWEPWNKLQHTQDALSLQYYSTYLPFASMV
jgi:hypothetical protein